MNKKRNTAVFIDGENITAKKAEKIMSVVRSKGVMDYAKVYGIQKDLSTRKWTEVAACTDDMKDIRLYGGAGHNKVDKKIKKDTIKAIHNSPNIDIICIVASDHGYASNARELRAMGKRVVIIGEKNTPQILRSAGNEFVMI